MYLQSNIPSLEGRDRGEGEISFDQSPHLTSPLKGEGYTETLQQAAGNYKLKKEVKIMQSVARILCCLMFLSVFVASTADAGNYPLYLQECGRDSYSGFACGSISYTGIDNVSSSYLESLLSAYGCPSLGYGMYWCSVSNSSLAQAYGYSLGIMSTAHSGGQYVYRLYLFVFD